MKRDEILKMEAGREMDALVAKKVMGFVDLGPVMLADLRYQKPTTDGVVVLGRLPCYSTDMIATWCLVEKIYQMGKRKEFLSGLYAQGIVNLSDIAHHPPDIDCRAVLLAMMD